ncbi:tRNA pseudouridine(13) synthase TruD [Micromonospora sp. MED01]|uniref:tRNA pseudouridine(13) synthase TruD n=1 Tax=Micromonospora alfalfae TaxID=2911212 RepID=UPI001EE8269A|nr:tRNA pseudouridine(13) synthase TruD [Micromonospora alfalfae]MCG5460306.1 tRNA pseudouridine(13) synthase TruD [Micromonospora alfalfae]
MAEGLLLPSYYLYYQSPVKIVETLDGGARVWRVSIDTGGWHEKNDIFMEITLGVGGEIFRRSPEDFVQEVERFRAHYLEGEGPIFALYETVQAVRDVAKAEDRHLTPKEQALIRGIRQRTFVMFEEQLRAAGDPGADPDIARVQ